MQKINNYTIKAVTTLLMAMALIFSFSCQSVKPYQRTYLNDAAMQMGGSKLSSTESYAQMIREGSSGGGGKSAGGCGCN